MCSALSQTALGSKVSSGVARRLLEINNRVRSIDAFKRKGVDEFPERHFFAIILWRPAQQAQKINEGFGQKSRVAVGSNAHHRAVLPLRELRSVRRNQQRKMRKLWRFRACAFENEHVFVRI